MLKTKKLKEGAILPKRSHPNDAGLDIYSNENKIIPPGKVELISTGIAMELPHGTVGLLLDRSSMGKKGIKVFGGVIDSDYRGEYIVALYNSSDSNYIVSAGDRIAQLVILPIILAEPYEVTELTETNRGNNNFGSTGV